MLSVEEVIQLRLGALKTRDGETSYLAQAKGKVIHVPQQLSDKGPSFDGTPDEFLTQYAASFPALQQQMKNNIRKCPKCSKVVAFTLSNCNGCGGSMQGVPLSKSNNIFTSFIYGIARGPFPFTISLRSQTEDILVFDDLLSMTPCHLNVISSSYYIPDWRWLLQQPVKGLALLNQMYESAWNVTQTQFLSNKDWRQQIFHDSYISLENMKECIATGFNYPPSQYQLHLQFMLMPMFPNVFAQYLDEIHYSKGRFFPYQYVKQVLELKVPFPNLQQDTSVDEIVEFYVQKGVDYNVVYAQCYEGIKKSHEKMANWQLPDFDCLVKGKGVFAVPTASEVKSTGDQNTGYVLQAHPSLAKDDPNALGLQDKTYMQNYGRPYGQDTGKPTGSYYVHAKAPGTLPAWQ